MTQLIKNPYFQPVDYTTFKGRNNIKNRYTKMKILERKEYITERFDQNITILDVGCAEGELLRELKNFGFKIENMYGVEPSLDAKEVCEFKIFKKNPIEKVFDLITCFHVLEHIIETQEFLCELVQMMNEDSKLIIEVPNWTGHPQVKEEKNSEHAYLFTVNSLISNLSEANLEILELHTKKFESPGYRENIRVLAQKRRTPKKCSVPNFPISIFGVGGDYAKYVKPLNLKIENYFDQDIKHLDNNIITKKYSVAFRSESILISSLHYEDAIYDYLIRNKHPKQNILLLSDLLMEVEI